MGLSVFKEVYEKIKFGHISEARNLLIDQIQNCTPEEKLAGHELLLLILSQNNEWALWEYYVLEAWKTGPKSIEFAAMLRPYIEQVWTNFNFKNKNLCSSDFFVVICEIYLALGQGQKFFKITSKYFEYLISKGNFVKGLELFKKYDQYYESNTDIKFLKLKFYILKNDLIGISELLKWFITYIFKDGNKLKKTLTKKLCEVKKELYNLVKTSLSYDQEVAWIRLFICLLYWERFSFKDKDQFYKKEFLSFHLESIILFPKFIPNYIISLLYLKRFELDNSKEVFEFFIKNKKNNFFEEMDCFKWYFKNSNLPNWPSDGLEHFCYIRKNGDFYEIKESLFYTDIEQNVVFKLNEIKEIEKKLINMDYNKQEREFNKNICLLEKLDPHNFHKELALHKHLSKISDRDLVETITQDEFELNYKKEISDLEKRYIYYIENYFDDYFMNDWQDIVVAFYHIGLYSVSLKLLEIYIERLRNEIDCIFTESQGKLDKMLLMNYFFIYILIKKNKIIQAKNQLELLRQYPMLERFRIEFLILENKVLKNLKQENLMKENIKKLKVYRKYSEYIKGRISKFEAY